MRPARFELAYLACGSLLLCSKRLQMRPVVFVEVEVDVGVAEYGDGGSDLARELFHREFVAAVLVDPVGAVGVLGDVSGDVDHESDLLACPFERVVDGSLADRVCGVLNSAESASGG